MCGIDPKFSADIHALCVVFGVKRLELFGSAARADFDTSANDFDFVVDFQPQGWKGSFKRYMGLKLGLEDLLGRPVDLVEVDASTNPYFVECIAQDRRLVYAA